MKRRLVLGDLHGNFKALKQVFKRAKFDYKKDELIIIGDVVDGYSYSYEVVEELIKVKNKTLVLGNHDSVIEDTEILTENGWVIAKNIKDEKIANFDIKTGKIEYTKPLSKIPIHRNTGLIFESYNMKQHVTPRHNLVVDNQIVKAGEFPTNKKINLSRFRHFGEINLKGLKFTDDYLRFLVWVICDGCLYSSSENKKRIQFKLSKKRKIDRLRGILEKLNISYTFKKATMSGINKLQPYLIRIYGEEARKVFKFLNGKKQFPNSFKNISKIQSKIFLEELQITDGHTLDSGTIRVTTINKKDADLIQIIMITNGYSCSVVKGGRSGFKNGKPQYLIKIYKKILNWKCVKCKTTGVNNFLCFTMPKGTLITRLNGKVSFTGNCWFMNYIANGWAENVWLMQGGEATKKSYESHGYHYKKMPQSHKDFFNNGVYYYEVDKMLFVHGGFDYKEGKSKKGKHPKDFSPEHLTWDRELINRMVNGLKIKEWNKIFVGHTSTENIDAKPLFINKHGDKYAKLINVDCGAGWNGRLCLYDIDTDEYFLSDFARKLNPTEEGR